MPKNNTNSKNNINMISVPFKFLRKEVSPPKTSNPGDAGADARIIGFKKIINENGKKELVEIDSDSYTLGPLSFICKSLEILI